MRQLWSPPLIGVLALAAALSGCTTTVPDAIVSPSPTATATPEPAIDAGPVARIDSTCEDILDAAALQAFMGTNVNALESVPLSETLTPDSAAGEQLGSLTCRWTNGLQGNQFTGPAVDAQSVRLAVLPEGLESAIEYVELYNIADPTYGEHVQGPRCVASVGEFATSHCELYGVIGETWVELTVDGIAAAAGTTDDTLVAGFRAVIDPLVAKIQAATVAARWVPGVASGIAGADCDALTPTDAIVGVTAIPNLRVGPQWDGPRVGQYWYTTGETGALRCSLAMADSDSSVGQIGILPNGAWAFDRFADDWRAEGGVPVDLDGVDERDAIIRCADAESTCSIDVVVGGDWMRVGVYPVPAPHVEYGPPAAYFESARSAAPAIAAIVAERMLAY